MAAYLPQTLEYRVHGHLCLATHIRWMNDHLEYYLFNHNQPRDQAYQSITPAPEAWQRFSEALDAISIWSWARRYDDPDILDGTQWEIRIRYQQRSIISYGSNAYPAGDAFERFDQAIRALIGQRSFEA